MTPAAVFGVAGLTLLAYTVVARVVVPAWRVQRRRWGARTFDQCEACGRPATHELVDGIEAHDPTSWTAMVACYCRHHAPDGAVRVRWRARA